MSRRAIQSWLGLAVVAGLGMAVVISTNAPTGADEGRRAEPRSQRKQGSGLTQRPERGGEARPDAEAEREITLEIVDRKGYDKVLADKDHRGQVVVVDFWATWCVPCLKNFKHTVEWRKKYGEQGLTVVSMSMDDAEDEETRERALEFLKKHNATFTNLLSRYGGEEEGMEAFDIDGGSLPHFKLYDRKGKLIKKFGGDPDKPVEHEEVEAEIRKALGPAR